MSYTVSRFLVLLVCVLVVDGAVPSLDLGGGVMMPQVGLGTCCGTYNAKEWVAAGGRHLDTADDYGSEGNLGNVVRASGIAREEFFITSKLEPDNYTTDMHVVMKAEVLEKLKMEYVDLILLHQAGRPLSHGYHPPCYNKALEGKNGSYYQCRLDGWTGLKKLKAQGVAKAIGVSNFNVRDLQQIYEAFGEYPQVNQIEYHPYYHEDSADKLGIASTVAFCKKNKIRVTSYAPCAAYPRGKMLDDPAVKALATEVGRTPGEVALRWNLQMLGLDNGIIVPRSKTAEHMKKNLALFDWSLTDDQVEKLNKLHQGKIYHTTCQPTC